MSASTRPLFAVTPATLAVEPLGLRGKRWSVYLSAMPRWASSPSSVDEPRNEARPSA